MLWVIILSGSIIYLYTLVKMDEILDKCVIHCDKTIKEEYKRLEFYNKVSFILGFPVIITGILLLKLFDWVYSKID